MGSGESAFEWWWLLVLTWDKSSDGEREESGGRPR